MICSSDSTASLTTVKSIPFSCSSSHPVRQDVFSAAPHNAGTQVETFGSVLHIFTPYTKTEHMGDCKARAPPSVGVCVQYIGGESVSVCMCSLQLSHSNKPSFLKTVNPGLFPPSPSLFGLTLSATTHNSLHLVSSCHLHGHFANTNCEARTGNKVPSEHRHNKSSLIRGITDC